METKGNWRHAKRTLARRLFGAFLKFSPAKSQLFTHRIKWKDHWSAFDDTCVDMYVLILTGAQPNTWTPLKYLLHSVSSSTCLTKYHCQKISSLNSSDLRILGFISGKSSFVTTVLRKVLRLCMEFTAALSHQNINPRPLSDNFYYIFSIIELLQKVTW